MPAYKVVFIAAGIGMLLSLVWFWFGRSAAQGHRPPPAPHQAGMRNVLLVLLAGVLVGIPGFYACSPSARSCCSTS
jgi:POT family proton-dependent oligopeptide transporter